MQNFGNDTGSEAVEFLHGCEFATHDFFRHRFDLVIKLL